ncbi:hypothetical protein [Chryseobacterium sp. RLHN22]|uniref:hypothetical protein n=1 Tax=Chryseobacterium sp. RLHN22 TaxID=3437885 RepID=UPI003D9AD72E
MKNKRLVVTALLGISTILGSCSEELTNIDSTSPELEIKDASVKNGRLYFPNKESLQYHYDQIKNESEEVIAQYVDDKNFISLRPVLTEKNEKLISTKLNERINKIQQRAKNNPKGFAARYISSVTSDEEIIDDIDDLEEIVGDDAYGAFLNDQAEIQVGPEIYKYTDVGLFVVNEAKYNSLEPYLLSQNISTDIMVRTDETQRLNYFQMHPCNQLTTVYDDISYYNGLDCGSTGGGYNPGGGGGGYTPPPVVDPNIQMTNFINGLQNCSPKNGLFDGVFGDSDVCIDKYESRYRVKTKAYNYNYYLVYNLGVKVKHQYKGWTGIWRKENAQEIRLGVISGQFSYDYASQLHQPATQYGITTIYNNNSRMMFDANVNWSQNGLNIIGYSTQAFPKILKDDIVIEQFSNNQYINQAIQAGNKQLTADKLSQHFWNYVVPNTGEWWQNLGKSKPAANNITYTYKAPEFGKILIQKTMYQHNYNDDKLEKSFDWGFQIGFKMGDDGNISPDTSGSALKKPQEFRILMYGIAKRNGVWHGSKINTINN